jgi:hypothetical protein
MIVFAAVTLSRAWIRDPAVFQIKAHGSLLIPFVLPGAQTAPALATP